jgi:putative ABC transport system permease protein
MRTVRLAKHSLRTMSRYKLRTSFMMLGTVIGIAALTFVVSGGIAAQRKTLQFVGQMIGDSGIAIQANGGETSGPRAPATRLRIEDLEAISKEVPGVEAWDPIQKLTVAVRHGDSSEMANILGESERWSQVWNRRASRGNLFDETAVTSSARVAIIGQTVAKELFRSGDPIGEDIQIESVPFKVIGILEPWGTNPHGMDRDNEIVVPISTLMRRLTNVNTISQAKVLASDPARADEMSTQMQRILRERHGLSNGQEDDFTILTPSQTREMVSQIERVLFFYLPLVAAAVLLVGAIVSASLMLASVHDRVAEIGLRRAIGARPADIRLQFLLETALTTLVGGLGGVALGYIAALIWAGMMYLGRVDLWMAALLGIATSSVVGVIAGVLPALRAARLNPAEALR